MDFVIKPSDPLFIPVKDTDKQFPVNSVYCVGRNYIAHSIELGNDPSKPPLFFTKPSWTVKIIDNEIPYPESTSDFQHEVELVIAMGSEKNIYGFAVGVDLTCRDLQFKAKKEGKPWFSAKVFYGSAPVSEIVSVDNNFEFSNLRIALTVNEELRQSILCGEMIWSPKKIINHLRDQVPLKAGDLIFTGTPSGVNKMIKGDKIHAEVSGFVELDFRII